MSEATIASLRLYDLVATYGRQTVSQFENLGCKRVEWIPLAGDPYFHSVDSYSVEDQITYGADVGFIGQWRPERENTLKLVLSRLKEDELVELIRLLLDDGNLSKDVAGDGHEKVLAGHTYVHRAIQIFNLIIPRSLLWGGCL